MADIIKGSTSFDKTTSTHSSSYQNEKNFNTEKGFTVGGIFRLIIALILAVTVLKFLLGSDNVITFRGFLETLTNAPQLNISNLLAQLNLEIVGDWGLLDGIRIFLNSIISIFTVLVYFCLSIAQGIVYISYFLRYLFLG